MKTDVGERKHALSGKRLRMFIGTFLEMFENHETRGTYERSLREFMRWVGTQNGFRFQVSDVESYKRYLAETKKLSDVSVSAYLTSLRRLCAFLVEHHALAVNPAKFVDGNKRPQTHSRAVLSNDEVNHLLNTLHTGDGTGLRDAAIVRLMLECGLSEAELVRTNVGDIRPGMPLPVLAVQCKGRKEKDREVPLTEEAAAAIRRYVEWRSVRPGGVDPGAPLFLSACNRTRGQRMSTRGMREVVSRYLTVAGIKSGDTRKISPHSLRYTAARRMADAGATADEIRVRMRLGTIETAELYRNKSAN